MGVTITSKRHSRDMGYGGFARFRNLVAEKVNPDFSKHYLSLSDYRNMFLTDEEEEAYFKTYDETTKKLIGQGVVTVEVANFLYQNDCEGKVDRKQAKQIYELIKACDDTLIFGYAGRADCTTLLHLKEIFSDGTKVEWC